MISLFPLSSERASSPKIDQNDSLSLQAVILSSPSSSLPNLFPLREDGDKDEDDDPITKTTKAKERVVGASTVSFCEAIDDQDQNKISLSSDRS